GVRRSAPGARGRGSGVSSGIFPDPWPLAPGPCLSDPWPLTPVVLGVGRVGDGSRAESDQSAGTREGFRRFPRFPRRFRWTPSGGASSPWKTALGKAEATVSG